MRRPGQRSNSPITAAIIAALVTASPVVRAAPAAPTTPTQPASAPAWGATFEPGAVGSYLGDQKVNVMVVGATSVAAPAAEALRAAMRASKRGGLIMDAQAIGVTENLDDKSIVERARTQPVGQIVIVRVFDSRPDDPPSTTLTFYRPDGTVVTAITGVAGTAIASNGAVAAAPEVSTKPVEPAPEVAAAPSPEAKPEVEVASEAQARYDAEYLWFHQWGGSAKTSPVVPRWSALQQGSYGSGVRGVNLYRIIGRDDLLKRFKTRRAIRFGVGIPVALAGLALLTVGAVVLDHNLNAAGPSFGADDPLQMGRGRLPAPLSDVGAAALIGAGGGLFLGGVIFAIAFRSHPVDRAGAAELVDTYNQGLRKKYGLGEPQARLRLIPSVGPRHTGLALGGRF